MEAPGDLYSIGCGVVRDAERAAFWYAKAADQGEPNAQYQLSLLYWYGSGVPCDKELSGSWKAKARVHLREAADAGDPDARKTLSYELAANGFAPPEVMAEVIEWEKEAAAKGDPDEQLGLYFLYHHGRHEHRDIPLSIYWLRKAAEQG